ncbi:MAG: biosynthetic arginine decarboxylase [Gammaproteobacteria bacterium]
MSNQDWNVSKAKQHYRIDSWSAKHFDINSKGNMVVKVAHAELDLHEFSKHLSDSGISLPVLVRFPQILQQSLDDLYSAFLKAIRSNDYSGEYVAAYPIKVNQQATVVQHYHDQEQWPIAFEVGSKAELMACLGISQKKQTIICNGYKDEAYIRLALMGCLLGHKIVIVIESLIEFQHVITHSSQLDVCPILGMRIRLSSIAKGNWQNTGGEHSKFGLTSNEVLSLVNQLRENNVLPWMKMLHFHMGSQIPSLQDIQLGMQEGMHYFSELVKQGLNLSMLNVGGGLAVDYEGSNSKSYFSMAYSLNDYADAVIGAINSMCEQYSLQPPTVFSENGRAMTAYHAVLLTNVIEVENPCVVSKSNHAEILNGQSLNSNLQLLKEYIKNVNSTHGHELVKNIKNFQEVKRIIQKIEHEFSQGELSLIEKAESEKLVSLAYEALLESKIVLSNEERMYLEDKFVSKYFCNFSLFQSTPDIWGLKQIFPIMPLSRLDEFPAKKARIYDLTCDSDGRIDEYVEAGAIRPYLSLHEYREQQDYVLGLFLVGAYQEILGDLHNLFGDTNTVNVVINADNSYQICDVEPGDTVSEILSYLHMDTGRMRKVWLERLSSNNVSEQDIKLVVGELDASIHANSYLS